MEAVMARVHERLHPTLFGVEEQLKSLSALLDAVRGGKGGSAIVYGQEESGRTAVVERALERSGRGVATRRLCLSRSGTESNVLQTLLESEASREPRIIVVDSADDLVCKSKQALLYRLLDRAKTGPWLVLLIIANQDMISSLEKRVRSRLPNVRVFNGEAMEEDEWWRLLERLMLGKGEDKEEEKRKDGKENEQEKPVAAAPKGRGRPKKGKAAKEEEVEVVEVKEVAAMSAEETAWAAYVSRVLEDAEARATLHKLRKYSGKLAAMKRVISRWLGNLEVEDVEAAVNPAFDEAATSAAFRRTVDELATAIEMVVPVEEQLPMVMNFLSRRSFCVLVAAARRLRCNPQGSFSYGKIAVDFLHQCNNVDRRMLPDAELQTFKELDWLCELQVLASDGPSTHAHSFRQIRLACRLPSLLSAVRAGLAKSEGLREWFESQPVN